MILATVLLSFALYAQETGSTTTTSAAIPEVSSDDVVAISGVVIAVRTSPVTEIFVRGAKHSVVVPPGVGHNELVQKAIEKQKTGGSMSFSVDAKTHRVIPAKAPAASTQTGPTAEEQSSK